MGSGFRVQGSGPEFRVRFTVQDSSAQRPAPSAERGAPGPESESREIRYMSTSLTRRLLVAALCTLPLVACGKSESGAPAAGAPAAGARGLKIAMIAKASTNPVF